MCSFNCPMRASVFTNSSVSWVTSLSMMFSTRLFSLCSKPMHQLTSVVSGDGDQHIGQLGGVALHEEHDGKCGHTHHQGREMRFADQLQRSPHVHQEMFAAPHRDAEQLVDLGQADDDRGRIGEADDDRMRQEADDDAQLECAQSQLDQADHQGQQDRESDELIGTGRGQRRKRRRGQQRHHRNRAGGQLCGRTPQRCDHSGQECGIQTIVGRQTGQLRIGHGLRDEHQRNGDARNEVGSECLAAYRPPGKEWEETRETVIHFG